MNTPSIELRTETFAYKGQAIHAFSGRMDENGFFDNYNCLRRMEKTRKTIEDTRSDQSARDLAEQFVGGVKHFADLTTFLSGQHYDNSEFLKLIAATMGDGQK